MVGATYAVPFTLVDERMQARVQFTYAAHQSRSLDGKAVQLGGWLGAADPADEAKDGGYGSLVLGPFSNDPLAYLSNAGGAGAGAAPATPTRPGLYRVAASGTPIQDSEVKVPASQPVAKPSPERDQVAPLDLKGLEESKF